VPYAIGLRPFRFCHMIKLSPNEKKGINGEDQGNAHEIQGDLEKRHKELAKIMGVRRSNYNLFIPIFYSIGMNRWFSVSFSKYSTGENRDRGFIIFHSRGRPIRRRFYAYRHKKVY